MSDFSKDDIRAAVAAGVLDESQAASLLSLAHERLGLRDGMVSDDEPFEFFKGFSEIFITVGLWLLFSGILAFGAVIGGKIAVSILGLILTWVFALYFTKKRRMSFPSISLAGGFGLFLGGAAMLFQTGDGVDATAINVAIMSAVGMAGMLLYFRFFKLPFAMFVFGAFGLLLIYSLMIGPEGTDLSFKDALFDLSITSGLAYGSLIFGLLAFALGIYFDTKDPHRISRHSATGFWLHILAAPVIVNTMAMTLFNNGGTTGYLLTAILLVFVTIVSLVIDRRSFLTAGIGYLAAIIGWAFTSELGDGVSLVYTLLVLGVFITILGTWWTQIRSWLMRLLPAFPYKDRFPPYIH